MVHGALRPITSLLEAPSSNHDIRASDLACGGGVVEIEEFLMGCLRLRGQARAIDTAKLLYDQNWLIKSQGR